MSKRRRLVTNTLANIGAQGISTLVALISLPIMLRNFGQSVYGIFILASSTVGLIAMFDFGVGLTTVKQVAAHLEREEPDELAETVSAATLLYGGIGLVAALALFVCGLFASDIFRVTQTEAELLRLMLWLHAAAQVIIWPANAGRHVLAGHQRFAVIVRIAIAVTLGNALVLIGVLLVGQGPLLLTALQVAVTTLGSLAMAASAWRMLPPGIGVRSVGRAALKRILSLGLPVFTIQIAAFLMRQQTDRIVLGVFLGAAAVALYEVAAKLGTLIAQLNDLTTSALLPYVTGLEAARDSSGVRATFLLGTRYIGLLVVPMIMMLTAWAPQIIEVWVGAQVGGALGPSVLAARLLMLSQFALALYSVADSILISKERFKRWTPYAVGLALLNLALSVFLVTRFGLVGVALGTLVASAVEAPLYLRVVFEETGVTLRSWAGSTLLPALGVGVFTLALSLGVASVVPLRSVGAFAVASAGVLSVVYIAAYLVVLSAAEKTMFSGLLGRRQQA